MKRTRRRQLNTRSLLRPAVSLLVPAALLFALALRWDFYYDLNDDAAMANILSGAYTGTPALRNIQSYFPLTAVLGGLQRLIGDVPWYGVFLLAVQFGCLALVLHRILGKNTIPLPGSALLCILAVLGYLALLLPHLVFVQYSVTVGILGATAAFLFLTMEPRATVKGWIREILPQLVLIWLGFLLRSEMLLFVSPLIALAFLIRWADMELPAAETGDDSEQPAASAARKAAGQQEGVGPADFVIIEDKKPRRGGQWILKCKMALLTLVLVLAGLAAGYLGNEIGYASEEWREFYAFFDARTNLYDFEKLPEYEGNEDFYESVGLSGAEADLILNYNFGIDDSIDADVLQQAADYADAKAAAEQTAKERLSSALWDYRHAEDAPYTTIAAALYVLAVLSSAVHWLGGIFLRKQAHKEGSACAETGCAGTFASDTKHLLLRLIELAVLFAGRSALLLYLYYNGRPVERLTHSLYLIEAVLLIWMILDEVKRLQTACAPSRRCLRGICIVFPAVLAAFFCWAAAVQYRGVQTDYASREEVNGDWLAFLNYCEDHPEKVYFTDVYSTVSFSEKIFADTPAAVNYDLLGGWMSGSPLELQKLTALGLAEDTAYGENKDGPTTGEIIETSLLENEGCCYAARSDYDTDWLVNYYASRGISVQVTPVDTIGDYWTIYQVREEYNE